MEAVQKSVQLFEEKRYREMRQKNIIGQVCNTPKSYDNVMHVGLRKVTFKWQRGNKIGKFLVSCFSVNCIPNCGLFYNTWNPSSILNALLLKIASAEYKSVQ